MSDQNQVQIEQDVLPPVIGGGYVTLFGMTKITFQPEQFESITVDAGASMKIAIEGGDVGAAIEKAAAGLTETEELVQSKLENDLLKALDQWDRSKRESGRIAANMDIEDAKRLEAQQDGFIDPPKDINDIPGVERGYQQPQQPQSAPPPPQRKAPARIPQSGGDRLNGMTRRYAVKATKRVGGDHYILGEITHAIWVEDKNTIVLYTDEAWTKKNDPTLPPEEQKPTVMFKGVYKKRPILEAIVGIMGEEEAATTGNAVESGVPYQLPYGIYIHWQFLEETYKTQFGEYQQEVPTAVLKKDQIADYVARWGNSPAEEELPF